MTNTYSDFKNLNASEKITLATIESSKRLIGWVLDSGSIYKLTNFDVQIIVSIEDSGSSYTEVNSVASITAGKFYNDRTNKILYLRASDSSNPNSRFLYLKQRHFFSNRPVSLPYDLSSGVHVYWEPQIQGTSEFGVELDNRNQLGIGIEGSGQLTLYNDNIFWPANYDKLIFENHNVKIYSYGSTLSGSLLPASEAKLIYRGKIVSKSYSRTRITFRLNDLLSQLRGEVNLALLSSIVGVRIPDNLIESKQRRIYGRVFGFRPTNIDQVLTGYPLSGTITATNGSDAITGVGTLFLKELSPDDSIIISGVDFTVESVNSNTSITLSESYTGPTVTGSSALVDPELPKKYINRDWKLSHHSLRQPETTIVNSNSTNFFEVGSTRDFYVGDDIVVGSEIVPIQRTSGNFVKTSQTLTGSPTNGTSVIRPCVQNVKINNTKLVFNRDYTVDAVNGTLSLTEDAEFNIAEIRGLNGTVTFTNGSRTVTGSNTTFASQLQPSMWIRLNGQADFFEILSIESDTALTLRTASTYSGTSSGTYKPVIYFNQDTDVLSCDILGITESGAKDGILISKGPQIVKHLIQDAGISDIDTASFTLSNDLAESQLGLVVPEKYDDKKTNKYRDIIAQINQSIFGSLIQNNSFQLQYNILSPKKPTSLTEFREHDILSFKVETNNQEMVKTVNINYKFMEFNPGVLMNSNLVSTKTSSIASLVVKTERIKDINTLLIDQESARIYSNRWAFILELGSGIVSFDTKLQAAELQVNNVIQIIHQKFYERLGGGKRKIAAIQSIKKSGSGVSIEVEDLSNAFTRCGTITENDALNFANSSEDDKVLQGYVTDTYGMQLNNPDTYGINLIW